VIVAIVGSGVDRRNAQFAAGQVLPGRDFLGRGTADNDCDGGGTFVAGLVAANPSDATTVRGLAPDATLLPVRVLESTKNGAASPSPDRLAVGIEFAVRSKADVIVVYHAATSGTPRLERAVNAALASDIVVVAGGRVGSADRNDASAALFPCDYPGVLGVAAIGQDGKPVAGSCSGESVDLAAPGSGLVSTAAGANGTLGHVGLGADSPGFAAGYVAGAVALVRANRPELNNDEVLTRLGRTADRPSSGRRDDSIGNGVVNLDRATAALATDLTDPADAAPESVSVLRPVGRTVDTSMLALGAALAFTATGALLLTAGARRAASRAWRPGSHAPVERTMSRRSR
jgi:membrane-anchored mycosin MYCP